MKTAADVCRCDSQNNVYGRVINGVCLWHSPVENLLLPAALECDNTDVSDAKVHLITVLILSQIRQTSFTVWTYAHMDGEADANWILFEPPSELWRRPPERACSSWLKNINGDLTSFDMELLEVRDAAQNRSFWTMLASYSAMHPQWCMLVLDWIELVNQVVSC